MFWRGAVSQSWHEQPFPHLIIDDAVIEPERLFELIDEEGVERNEADLYAFDASPREPTTGAFRALRDELAATWAPLLSQRKAVRTTDMRAYAYRVGDYLLPHTDHQDGLDRRLAYAYYLPSPEQPVGGELELFACRADRGELVAIESAKLVEPRANRLVVFDVSDVSLHQVREVLGGLRLSLAGWFYP